MKPHKEVIEVFGDVRLAVVGDIMLDRFVFGRVDRISPEAPVPVLQVDRTEEMPGGAANVARNVASLGASTTIIGIRGEDADGRILEDLLSSRSGICPCLVTGGGRTLTKTRYVSGAQQLLRADNESLTISAEAEDEVLRRVSQLSGVRSIICSDYAKGIVTAKVFLTLLEAGRTNEAVVVVDPKRKDFSFYAGASVITPNCREAAAATNIPCESDAEVEAAAKLIAEQARCATVVITRGGKGITILQRERAERIFHLPTVAREVYNVAGAGDTFVATLAVALAAGAPIETASHLANLAAGLAVARVTTAAIEQDELASAADLSELVADRGKIMSVETAAMRAALWRRRGERVVFTNGCFDLLHPGHLGLLKCAAAEGDRLIVGLNSDTSVERLKGSGRPLQAEGARAMVLAALEDVDLVVIFGDDTPLALIEAIDPDVLVKGADYRENEVVGGAHVRARGGRIVLAPTVEGFSTSRTVERVRAAGSDDRAKRVPAAHTR